MTTNGCTFKSIFPLKTQPYKDCVALSSLVPSSVTSLERSPSPHCKSGLWINRWNYATYPPYSVVHWTSICGGNQCVCGFLSCVVVKLIQLCLHCVYRSHVVSLHLCFSSAQIWFIDLQSNYAAYNTLSWRNQRLIGCLFVAATRVHVCGHTSCNMVIKPGEFHIFPIFATM